MKVVEFYFDFVSPYAWLAAHQLGAVRDSTGVKFRFVPVLFAGLLDHHANIGPAEIPAKRRYTFVDAQRWAAHLGLEFKSPPAHPFNPLKPLRVTSAIDDDAKRELLSRRLLDAAWSDGQDITADAVIEQIADHMRLDGKTLLASAQTERIKQRLRQQTDAAVAAGAFGVPTFVVDGEVFWGNDRLPFLQAYLQGKLTTDKTKMEEILSRPRAADRRRQTSDVRDQKFRI
jgi:2-hydroxychromene-2-carboxylate isomerase